MNLSHGTETLDPFFASVEQVEDDDAAPPASAALSPPSVSDLLQHRKKFRDPNVMSFSFLSRPARNSKTISVTTTVHVLNPAIFFAAEIQP